MATFLQLAGLSLVCGFLVMAAFWPLLWIWGVFETPVWIESIKSRFTGAFSHPIAKNKV
jgi:hypothetical protein